MADHSSATTPQQPVFPPGFLEESTQPAVRGVGGLFIALCTIAVVLRFVARWIGKVVWRWDDAFVLIGYILFVAMTASCLADVTYGGVGLHAPAVIMIDKRMLITFFKFFFIVPMLYLPAVIFPKLALLAIYLSIFTEKPYRLTCWTVGGIIIANWAGATTAGLCSCMPLSYLWEQIEGAQGSCFDINSWFRWSSFANIITDIILLVLPIPMVWKLQVPKSVRIGLMFTFLLGSLGLVASVIRFIGFFTIDAVDDPTWSAVPLIIWTIVESGMYLVACCLPTYRPLMKKIGLGIANTLYRRSDINKHDGSSKGTATKKGSNLRAEYKSDNSHVLISGQSEEDRIGLVEEYGVPMNRIRVDHQFQVE